jgi:hypothetical protein
VSFLEAPVFPLFFALVLKEFMWLIKMQDNEGFVFWAVKNSAVIAILLLCLLCIFAGWNC